jgi:hypothetical protein
MSWPRNRWSFELADHTEQTANDRLWARANKAQGAADTLEQSIQSIEPSDRVSKEYEKVSRVVHDLLERHSESIKSFLVGFEQLARNLHVVATRVADALPSEEALGRFEKINAQRDKLDVIGFLPHQSMRLIIEDDGLSEDALSQAIENHFSEHWLEVAEIFQRDIDGFDVDDEAKATFREALAAHGNGHYRSVCRLLFPEFERIIRYELHGGQLSGLTSLRSFRKFVEELGLSEALELGGFSVFSLMETLIDRLYSEAKDPAQIELLRSDPIPNRHACLHGIISYNTAKNSINMLVMADFVYRVVGLLKANKGTGDQVAS